MTIRLLPALALAAQTALAQQPAVSLRGQVVDAENDRPLRRAIVSLARGDDRVRPVLTDEEGRFEIELPEASSEIVIAKAGYASTILQPDPRTQSRELDIRLPRGATMSGRVIESGIPVIGAPVVARPIEPRPRASFVSAVALACTTSKSCSLEGEQLRERSPIVLASRSKAFW
jgi:hypothetical protein